MKYILILVVALGLVACNGKKNEVPANDENTEAFGFTGDMEFHVWPDSVEDILRLPDSLLVRGDSIINPMDVYSPEQKALAIAIQKIMVNNVTFENGAIVLKMTREEFIKTGIPEPYYDQLVSNLKVMNHFEKEMPSESGSMEEKWNDLKDELQNVIQEYE